MRIYLICLLSLFAVCGISNAAMMTCTPPAAGQIVVQAPPGSSAFTETCGPLTINAFMAISASASNALPVTVNLVTATYDPVVGVANLTFNPNFAAGVGTTNDVDFYFTVTGGVNGISLATGGTNSNITERACSTPIFGNPGNSCTGGLVNQLAFLSGASGQANQVALFTPPTNVNPVYIFKDVLTDGRGTTNGAGLTGFGQDFEFGPTVPEPMSFGLMGAGLAGLGVLRRFISKA